ncbi:MAG: SDR family NAD(P)-dependent oxidoreductase [Candidatus Diapherotrites archaeon]
MKKKVLVTGGAGFIGSFIADELVKRGHDVRIFDNLEPQVHKNGEKPEYLNPKAEFVKGDVRERAELGAALEGIDVVFHEASAVGVGQSMYEIEKYVDVNVRGTACLMDLLVNGKGAVKKVIAAASMSSYGEGCYKCEKCGIVAPPLRSEGQMRKAQWEPQCPACGKQLTPIATPETKIQNPNSIYALTKKEQEGMIHLIGKTYGIKTCALRYFNVFGPRQSLNNPYTGVAAIFMSRLKNNNRPVVNEDGVQTRDFISVHDVAQANMLAMESNAADYESFNVGSGKPQTIKGIAEMLAELLGKEIKPEIGGSFRKGDVRHCFADITKIKSRLGFAPKFGFAEGMRELAEWAASTDAEDRFEDAAEEMKKRGLI